MARIALVAQCGGPTAVINASLAALIEGWQAGDGVILGARNGMRGVATGNWVDLSRLSTDTLARLAHQTGSALGGGRDRLEADEVAATLVQLHSAGVEALFLIGGNGTMAAANAIAQLAGDALQVIGIPKTIDNDLIGTDVAPGFLSAAHFAIHAARGAALDLRAMATFDDVAVIEVMGRHAGWLTAATALARAGAGDAPHLLLLPEAPVDERELLARVKEVHAKQGICLIAASEGARNLEGEYLGELAGKAEDDASGQRIFAYSGGVAAYLAQRVRTELGLRCRQMRPDTLFRTGGGLAHTLDLRLARLVGSQAVAAALAGESGVMIGLRRPQAEGDDWSTELVPLDEVVGKEHLLPPHFIAPGGMNISDAFRDWAAGLLETPDAPVLLTA